LVVRANPENSFILLLLLKEAKETKGSLVIPDHRAVLDFQVR
jgi:hypothetical protein